MRLLGGSRGGFRSGSLESMAQQLFCFFEITLQCPAVQQMLETGGFPVAPVSIGNKHTNQLHNDLHQFRRWNEHTEVTGKRLMSGRSSEGDAKGNSIAMQHGAKPYVVRVLGAANNPAAVKGDVKLAGQIIKLARRDDDLRKLIDKR